ncbi:MAG: hypothetical protein NT099_00250 [Candidatus Saganbacteria bacterium]|nr:hypothetical protein [Candidatus Saganbacteria bacterium]
MNKRIILTFIVLLCLTAVVFAGQSSNFTSSPEATSSGGGNASSSNFSSNTSVGSVSGGNLVSASFSALSGFLSMLVGADITAPTITTVKIDSQTVVNNDYVKKDGTLTAVVQDGTGVSIESSAMIIDSSTTYFKNLTSPSTYDASTGNLTYVLNLSTGTHTIVISAVDYNNNTSTYTRTVRVDTGDPAAAMAYIYPNPFNPLNGPAKIAYQLNRDSDVTLYMFNEINQLVWKRVYLSGVNGGKSGYNEISWDGNTDFGDLAGNGPYFLRIVSGGKMIGKIKIAVLK